VFHQYPRGGRGWHGGERYPRARWGGLDAVKLKQYNAEQGNNNGVRLESKHSKGSGEQGMEVTGDGKETARGQGEWQRPAGVKKERRGGNLAFSKLLLTAW